MGKNIKLKRIKFGLRWKRVAIFILILGIALANISSGNFRQVEDVRSPIVVQLNVSKIPVIDEETDILFRLSSILDAPNTTASIILPDGVELINGTLTGRWDLKANEPGFLNATVKFKNPGDYEIKAEAHRQVDEGTSWGDQNAIYLTIGQEISMYTPPPIYAKPIALDSDNLTEIPAIPINVSEMRLDQFRNIAARNISSIKVENGSAIVTSSNFSDSSALGSLTFSGYWDYVTEIGDVRVTPNTQVHGKYWLVGIFDANYTYLGETYTDENGYWTVTVNNPYPVGVQIVFFAYTKWDYFGQTEMRVVADLAGGTTGLDDVYYWYSDPIAFPDGSYDLGTIVLTDTEPYLKACWLLDDLNRAFLFMLNNGGNDGGPATIYWHPSLGGDFSYSDGTTITMRNVDAPSADISIHEYGHNVMWNAYDREWWPDADCPSPHYMETLEDLGCAWTEGWANFLPLAVNGNSIYSWSKTSYTNLETQTWGTAGWDNGPGVEGRVAGAMYDIIDTANDGADQYSFPFANIANVLYSNRNNNFAEFWNSWRQTHGYSDLASKCIYQNTIDFRPGKIAIFRNGGWYFDLNGNRAYDSGDVSCWFGSSGDIPVPGDWNRDGRGEIAIFRNGIWYFDLNGNRAYDSGDVSCWFGSSGDLPVAGDWNSDGKDEIAIFRNGIWYFDLNGNRAYDSGDVSCWFGASGDLPVAGDWNNDGKDEIAILRNGIWYFDLNGNRAYDSGDVSCWFGSSGDLPVAGDWNSDGKDEIAILRNGIWYLDLNGNRAYDSGDVSCWFGASGDLPVADYWN